MKKKQKNDEKELDLESHVDSFPAFTKSNSLMKSLLQMRGSNKTDTAENQQNISVLESSVDTGDQTTSNPNNGNPSIVSVYTESVVVSKEQSNEIS